MLGGQVSRKGDTPNLSRWLVHRTGDGTLFVVGIGADPWEALAASAAKAQAMIGMGDAEERRANAERGRQVGPEPTHP